MLAQKHTDVMDKPSSTPSKQTLFPPEIEKLHYGKLKDLPPGAVALSRNDVTQLQQLHMDRKPFAFFLVKQGPVAAGIPALLCGLFINHHLRKKLAIGTFQAITSGMVSATLPFYTTLSLQKALTDRYIRMDPFANALSSGVICGLAQTLSGGIVPCGFSVLLNTSLALRSGFYKIGYFEMGKRGDFVRRLGQVTMTTCRAGWHLMAGWLLLEFVCGLALGGGMWRQCAQLHHEMMQGEPAPRAAPHAAPSAQDPRAGQLDQATRTQQPPTPQPLHSVPDVQEPPGLVSRDSAFVPESSGQWSQENQDIFLQEFTDSSELSDTQNEPT